MELKTLRVFITLLATLTAIIFILLSFQFSEYSVLILTIEVILLPSIYIIGYYFIEDKIEQ